MIDTRIKITTDCNSVSYTCQYKTGWQLVYTWHNMHIDLYTVAEFITLQAAQQHIDQQLIKQAEYAEHDKLKALKKKTKRVEYVKYP